MNNGRSEQGGLGHCVYSNGDVPSLAVREPFQKSADRILKELQERDKNVRT